MRLTMIFGGLVLWTGRHDATPGIRLKGFSAWIFLPE